MSQDKTQTQSTGDNPKKDTKTTTTSFNPREYFKTFVKDVLDLEHGVDRRAVIADIKSKISMSGPNAWMLMCSIVIASIGLDLNSQAVIIGAMLISPLMSPILGIGLAVGINDMNTLKKSLSHFAISILIALVTSSIYFYLSPFDVVTPQIEARTEPTFLDVLIAFFGGIAGIISYARKDISTTIPGVAIATALMPPLCVTGFGIANGMNWDVALSSFYLFFVNTFFVALATFLIVRFLNFPLNKYMDPKTRRKSLMYMAGFTLLVSLPSMFIFSRVWKKISTDGKIEQFFRETIKEDQIYLDDHELVVGDSINTLFLKVYGYKITKSNIPEYNEKLKELGLKNTHVQIIPTTEIKLDRINQMEGRLAGVQELEGEIAKIQEANNKLEAALERIRLENKEFRIDSTTFRNICYEVSALQKDILQVDYAETMSYDFERYRMNVPIVIIDWSRKTRDLKTKQEEIEKFLRIRMKDDKVEFVHR